MQKGGLSWLMPFLVLAGCEEGRLPVTESRAAAPRAAVEGTQAAEPLPPLDTRSPDSVVRSYWALQEWAERNAGRDARVEMGNSYRRYSDARLALGAGDYAAVTNQELDGIEKAFEQSESSRLRVEQRDILEVNTESETRAVVLTKIRNVTPLPPGYSLGEIAEAKRAYGKDVRYVTEKSADGWRLSQAWYRDDPEDKEWTKAWTVKQQKPGSYISDFDFYYADH